MRNTKKILVVLVMFMFIFILVSSVFDSILKIRPKLDTPIGIISLVALIAIIALFLVPFVFIIKRVKRSKELKEEKNEILRDEKNELVEERRKYIRRNLILIFICVLCVILNIFFIEKLFHKMFYIVVLLFVLSIVGGIFIIFHTKFKDRYKTILWNNVINSFINNSKFNLNYYMDTISFKKRTDYVGNKYQEIIDEYLKAKFENKFIKLSKIENYINGYYGDIFIQLADVYFANKYDIPLWPSGGVNKYEYYYRQLAFKVIFNGELVIIDKDINSEYIKLIDDDIDDLNLESDEVDSNLKSDLKNFLQDFMKKYKLRIDMVIKDKIYIKFYCQNMFDFKLFDDPIDMETVNQLQVITEFIEELLEIIGD